MVMYAKVRRMRLREGLSISEIARRTSPSRNTIKRWVGELVRKEMRYVRTAGGKNLDAHAEWQRKALAADTLRPRKERRTALRLLEQLKELGYSASYSRLTEFIRGWRSAAGSATARSRRSCR